ncbi:MAG: aquaporin [Phycisphaerales bacterium]|nr:aquaporin [Phycisphaerales bacterium]
MRSYVTEFVGTFFLVFTIGLAPAEPVGALAIGAVLTAMVYMGGPISGAHYNPAVSLAMLLRGKLAVRDLIPYWISQLGAAIAAAAVVRVVADRTFGPMPGPGVGALSAILVEILFTFALVLVILNVATSRAAAGNSYFGVAIGLTVAGAALVGGKISGGAFNPAVGIGPNLLANQLGSMWIYVIGPAVGAIAATVVYKVQHAGEA